LYGQTGDGATDSWRLAPSFVIGLQNGASAISASGKSTCAITLQGSLQCWGWNAWGQLGDGTRTSRNYPADVSGLTSGVRAVTVGGSGVTGSACAVTVAGGVKCWGHNHGGQLGDGTTIDRYVPVDVVGLDGAAPASATVIEYYNASLDHYFITWLPAEIAILDAGTQIRGWKRTGYSFKTYPTAQYQTSPVCRYYIPPGLGDSHFFGRGTAECNATGQKNPSFVLEDPAFMQMFLPVAGVCPAGTTQVYRVFSNRPDANHRYMTDKAVRDQMVAKGWLAEGDGPDLVVMCAPQ
jgi:hypothetical protein